MVSAPGLFRRAVHNFSPPTKRLSTVAEKRFLSHQNFSSTKNLANKSTNNTSFTRVVFTPMFEAATGDHYLSLGSRRPRYESGTASHVKPNSVVQMQCTQVERRVKRKKTNWRFAFSVAKKSAYRDNLSIILSPGEPISERWPTYCNNIVKKTWGKIGQGSRVTTQL